ncbi:MAG: hypothetical protein KAU28_01140 [Phycisphaerae bacterium]|nr:hypothetical protein [Phycisphaerae bacterium]
MSQSESKQAAAGATAAAALRLGFVDGLKYLFVHVAPRLEDVPAEINRLLTLIEAAERFKRVPRNVPMAHSTGKFPWDAEFERQRRIFRARGGFHSIVPVEQNRRRGRPSHELVEVS